MDLNDLDRFLGIDPDDALDLRARKLVEADAGYLDDLVRLRTKKNLSQSQIADRMGVTQSAVARIEGGDRDPRLSTLRRYALAVGAEVVHTISDDEAPAVRTPHGVLGSHAHVEWPQPSWHVEGRGAQEAGVEA